MPTSYFTFGQNHVHRVQGKTFDCDCVVKITADAPAVVMVEHFGLKWGAAYDDMPSEMLERYYPRGIIELNL